MVLDALSDETWILCQNNEEDLYAIRVHALAMCSLIVRL